MLDQQQATAADRYFDHALCGVRRRGSGTSLLMHGKVRAGVWLPFDAEQWTTADAFTWRAKAGVWPLPALEVTDAFADGQGSMDFRVLGVPVKHLDDESVTRSAIGRAALEAVAFAPQALVDDPRVSWLTPRRDHVIATFDLGEERPEVHLELGADGALQSVWAERWHDDRYAECRCDVLAERQFGHLRIPSRVVVSWDDEPFFFAEVVSAEELS